MKKSSVFRGVATALITPMQAGGEIDYAAFGRLIDWQITSGVKALVIAGTTGEGSTLSDEEHRRVLEYAVERIHTYQTVLRRLVVIGGNAKKCISTDVTGKA